MSAGRQEAFDHFRRDNPLNHKLEEHKRILKQRYTEAKTLGEEVNQSRNRISNKHFLVFFGITIVLFSRSSERTIRTDAFTSCWSIDTR
jgi:hypothetical protein